ncbi:MAG: hypothetical protein Tsb0021_03220 [Chlamydiales bacterium]
MFSSGIHTIHSSLSSALRCITHLQRKIDAIFRRIFSRNSQQPQQNQRFNPTTISVLTNSMNISLIPGMPSVFETSQAFQNYFRPTNTESQKNSLSSLFDSIPKTEQGIENLKDRIDEISYSTNMGSLRLKPMEEFLPMNLKSNFDWNQLDNILKKYCPSEYKKLEFIINWRLNMFKGISTAIFQNIFDEAAVYMQYITEFILTDSKLSQEEIHSYLSDILYSFEKCEPFLLQKAQQVFHSINLLNRKSAEEHVLNLLENFKTDLLNYWGTAPKSNGGLGESSSHFLSVLRLQKGEEWGLLKMGAEKDLMASSLNNQKLSFFENKINESYGNAENLINTIETRINIQKKQLPIFHSYICEVLKNNGFLSPQVYVSDTFFDEDGNILTAGVKFTLLNMGILIND